MKVKMDFSVDVNIEKLRQFSLPTGEDPNYLGAGDLSRKIREDIERYAKERYAYARKHDEIVNPEAKAPVFETITDMLGSYSPLPGEIVGTPHEGEAGKLYVVVKTMLDTHVIYHLYRMLPLGQVEQVYPKGYTPGMVDAEWGSWVGPRSYFKSLSTAINSAKAPWRSVD